MTVAALVATAVAAGAVTASPALAADNGSADTAKSVRISGADRYATTSQASVEDFPAAGSAHGVVIARGDLYVDALAGTPLATAKQAALLLTDGSSLTPGVAAEIQRALGSDTAKTITILGGADTVSPQVEAQLKALGHPVDRIGDADRYATAEAVATSRSSRTPRAPWSPPGPTSPTPWSPASTRPTPRAHC
ncbi:cell wall-binding repeat-containing protein [Catenulispora sp. MAP5-51]|uniref:cell wall-binding repeat-containing protein n=1 Tax=unclassified Catenulispora TaxID=414885 RepID=UPI003511B33F